MKQDNGDFINAPKTSSAPASTPISSSNSAPSLGSLFFSQSPDLVIILDLQGRVKDLNPAVEKVTGFKRQEALGINLGDLLVIEQRQAFLNWLELRIKGNASPVFELEIEGVHGERCSLEINTNILMHNKEPALILAVGRDITDRKYTLQSLEEDRRLLRTLLDHLPEAICVKDRDGRYVINNLAHAQRFAILEPALMTDKTDADFMDQKTAEQIAIEEDRIFKSGQPIANKEESSHVGTPQEYWSSTSKIPFRNQRGDVVGLVSISRDITDRKQMEIEREKLIKDLQDALGSVKTLTGLLPICAYCKKIRDDKGYWNQLEAYLGKYSSANFSHGICPDCANKMREEIEQERVARDSSPKTGNPTDSTPQ